MTKGLKYLLLVAIPFFGYSSYAQPSRIDSLYSLLKNNKEDTNKVNILNILADEFKANNPDTALYFAECAFLLAGKINYIKGLAQAHLFTGMANIILGKYDVALNHLIKALPLSKDKKFIARIYNNIGLVYYSQGNYPEALKNHFTALKIRIEIGDKQGIAASYNNMGIIYSSQGNYSDALKNHFAAMKIREEIGDKLGIAASCTNIGVIYSIKNIYDESLKYDRAALKIREEIGDKNGIATSYSNIGVTHIRQGNYSEALKNQDIALSIRKEIGDKSGIVACYLNIAEIQFHFKNPTGAQRLYQDAFALSKEIGDLENLKDSYHGLSQADSALGNWRGAYENHKMFIRYRDSLVNEENTKKTVQQQMQFEFDKKEALTKAEQNKKDVLAKEESRKQRIITGSITGGLFLVIVFSGFIFRSLRITQRQKEIIGRQKEEAEKSRDIIEEKNKEITDSINYAKRIQKAMLPHRKDIWMAFPQSFVLYKPKDIVSGDFYFFHKGNDLSFIAAGDCTGHGVPGAFMSLIGSDKLEDAVCESSDTSEILSLLNKGIKTSLKQVDGKDSTRDGMDIALCCVDSKNSIVRFAGANRPLWIIRNGQSVVEEIKATKTAIGGLTEDSQHFETHVIQLKQGDTFYLFTDGYADTFGKDGKKLMTRRFKDELISIQDKTMKEQEGSLDAFIENWKGQTEQIDDILVMGVRL